MQTTVKLGACVLGRLRAVANGGGGMGGMAWPHSRWLATTRGPPPQALLSESQTQRTQQTQRPSKTAAKQEAKRYLDVSRQLCKMTDRQLENLLPLLGEEVLEAAGVARGICRRNQGRGRQENLVAKLLREAVEDLELHALEEAVDSVRLGQGVVVDRQMEMQVEAWMDGLLADQKAAGTEVFGIAQQLGMDLQALRQLVRQAPAPQEQQPGSGTEGEVMAASPTPASQKRAQKQLRDVLRQLAVHELAGASSDDDDEEEEE